MEYGSDDLPHSLGVFERESQRLHGVHHDAVILLVVYSRHLVSEQNIVPCHLVVLTAEPSTDKLHKNDRSANKKLLFSLKKQSRFTYFY